MKKTNTKDIIFYSCLCVAIAIFVAAVAYFTPRDYGITSSLYKRGTTFGVVFEILGPVFMPFFTIYSVVGVTCLCGIKNKTKKILCYIGVWIFYVYAFFMGTFTLKYSYAPYLFVPSIIAYVGFTGFSFFISEKCKKNGKAETHLKVCLVMLFTCLVSLVLVDIIKLVFGRIRYFELGDGEYYFWYRLNSPKLNSSFPSGHVSRAATALCFGLLFEYSAKKNTALIIFTEVFAVAFTVAVAVSRLYEGMHYPVDIITGGFLTALGYYISKKFMIWGE